MITQKVLPQTADFEMSEEAVYATSGYGNKLLSFHINKNLETNIQFIAIPIKDGDLAYMRKI